MTRPSLLRHHRDFRLLWLATAVSQLGTQVSGLALPLVAILTLHATAFEVGVLLAIEFLPLLVVGLLAGALSDRWRRRPTMILADVVRAVVLASIPAAFLLHGLSLVQLYAVALIVGALSVFFDAAAGAYLPQLVAVDRLQDANSALQVGEQGAGVGGPALGGLLVNLVGAPVAVLADAVSYVCSAIGLLSIASVESRPGADTIEPTRDLAGQIRAGLAFVLGHPYLRPLMLTSAISQFFGRMIQAVLLVYLVRDAGLEPGVIGVVLSIGSAGFLLGALVAPRLARAVGLGRTLAAGTLITATSPAWLALAPRTLAAAGAIAWMFAYGLGALIWTVNSVSLRQSVTPNALRGRVGASIRTASWGVIPIASVIGGALGSAIGAHPTIVLGATGALLGIGPIFASRIPALRVLPAAA